MNRQESISRTEIHSLTSLRFFAAILVVCYHFSGASLEAVPRWVLIPIQHGNLSVTFFFVLSGFILSLNYVGANGTLTIPREQFFRARIARIFPLFLFAFLLDAPGVIAHRITSDPPFQALLKLIAS